jgi:hypothetical protein
MAQSPRGRSSLPTFLGVASTPTVDQARETLGGRASTDHTAGARVRVGSVRGAAIEGVVVFGSERERDVWIGEGRFQRIAAGDCETLSLGDPALGDRALDAVADDARRFATFVEGAAVRYLDRSGRAHEGTLVEKCRYGALVMGEGGRILAVGFRRITSTVDRAAAR